MLANLTTESAKLTARQNYESNGFETWRRLVKKYSLPDGTRHVSLVAQLLDLKFNPQNFEQDFNSWESFKVKYEKQTGTELPDSVLVATVLNKTSGPLQQHLRLSARNLTTYEDIRATILEYHQSRHILAGAASSSQGPAPMDIGGLERKKGFGKGGSDHFKGKKGKGKGKSKKGKGKNPRVNFHHAATAKGIGKGKEKGKSKLRGQHALVCWTCGKSGDVASQCPSGRVSALDESLFGEVEDPGNWIEEDWTSGDWSEDWWSDELVAAVFASDTWDDDWWWSTWDEGWSDAWTDSSWSVVPAPAEKATSLAAPAAPEPKATSGAAASAVTLEPVPSSKAKAKATSKAPAKASGLALAAVTLGSMFAGTSSCLVVPPRHDVSLGCMLEGDVDVDDFSASVPCVDSSSHLPSWELSPGVYHLPHQDELGDGADVLRPKTLENWELGNLDTRFFDPYLAEHELVVASVDHPQDEYVHGNFVRCKATWSIASEIEALTPTSGLTADSNLVLVFLVWGLVTVLP